MITMPLKQQYCISAAIIGLIAVLLAFAMFDYYSDERRYAEQTLIQQGQGAGGFSAASPYGGAAALAQCGSCGWNGARAAGSALCPNCARPLGAPAGAISPVANRIPGDAQNAGFLWLQSRSKAPQIYRNTLSCPSCSFNMSTKYAIASNSVRCPQCPAYLLSPAQASVPAQAAAFGTGGGFNPNCAVNTGVAPFPGGP